MLRICYMSRMRPGVGQTDALEILRVSRQLNQEDGITGLLLCDGDRFLQALEGPADAVSACYARIHHDRRHHSLRLLTQEDIERREFGGWTMAYRVAGGTSPDAFLDMVRDDVQAVSDAYLQMLFTGFAARRADAPALA